MARRYGVPYQGSKNGIARQIVDFLPPGDALVDLFAGGCAVTHAALEQKEGLARLESLAGMSGLDRLETSALDYADVPIAPGAVIYCDIPYQGTDCKAYEGFDHARFFDWAARQAAPVYISSYRIDDPRFKCVLEMPKRCTMAGGAGEDDGGKGVYHNRKKVKVVPHKGHYTQARHKRWREKVLRQEGYLCQTCKRYGRIDKDGLPVRATTAHHVKPIDKYPELAYDVSNGMALCAACHDREHPEKGGHRW